MAFLKQPTEVQALSNVLNTYLRWKSLNGPPRGYEIYHPSAFGSCLRRMQYQRYAERGHIEVAPIAHEAKTVRIFDSGHSMHDRWAKYWEEIGVLRGIWECKNPCCRLWDDEGNYKGDSDSCPFVVPEHGGKPSDEPLSPPRKYGKEDKLGAFKPERCVCGCQDFEYHEITVYDKELNFRGHVDQIIDFSKFPGGKTYKEGRPVKVLFKDEDLPKEPIVVDMKSINAFGFKTKLEDGAAPFGYRVQVNIYLHLLDLQCGVLYFENKDNSGTRLVHVPRDPDLWEKIKEQARTMTDMVDDLLLPPPRPKGQGEFECRNCEFQSICHSSGIWEDPNLAEKRLKFYGGFS